jgi:outer membrane immunogenic protein
MKALIGIAGIAALAALAVTPGYAADMSPPPPVYKAPPPPVSTWTGCYIDGGVGYGLWNQDHTTTTAFDTDTVTGLLTTVSQTDGGRGWLGRVGAGCDYQVAPRWVIGVLGSYDFMDLTGTNSPLEVDGAGFPVNAPEKENGAWYVGGRVGYLIAPSVLSYVSGGFTQTRFDAQTFQSNLGVPEAFGYPAQTYNGWFLGGGFETSLSDYIPGLPTGLYLRTEYRFSEYERIDLPEILLPSGVADGNVEHTRPTVQTVTTSLVWKLNWAAPVMANW